MNIVPRTGLTIRSTSRWPNMLIFPRELRDAIPDYAARALVFDSVAGATHNLPHALSSLPGAPDLNTGPRAQAQLLVHETGSLKGQFSILMDLDSSTMRALGQFLIDLADRAETLA